jgi:beta-phosphoglucomutase
MAAHVHAWQEVFADYGVELPAQKIRLREGEKAVVSAAVFCQEYGLELLTDNMNALLKKKREIYRAYAPSSLRPDVVELLYFLIKKGFKLALVTGSIRENLNLVMKPEEQKLFDVIITSESVENSKPEPDPYEKACRDLKLPPEECLVVENAPLGIKSAKSAGMKVAAITSTLPENDLKESDWIINSLNEVLKILSNVK